MPLFKTKYNDVDKAIKALKNEQATYDIGRANEQFFKDPRFVALAVREFGIGILDKAGDWVYKNHAVMSAAYEQDKSILEKASLLVRGDVCKTSECFYWIFKPMESDKKHFILCQDATYRGQDSAHFFWYNKEVGKYKKIEHGSSLASRINNHLLNPLTGPINEREQSNRIIFLSKINMMIFSPYFGFAIIFPVDDFLQDGKNNIADCLNLSYPDEIRGRVQLKDIENFDFNKWFQPKHETKNLNQEYLRNIIIPFVDNLLLGKKIVISTQKDKTNLISEIIQDGLSSLPVDKANSYSFCTDPVLDYRDPRFEDLQIWGTIGEYTKKADNKFVLNAEQGCKTYIPQTEYAKQMLAKLNENESKQSVQEVVEQPTSEHKKNDHELS